MTNAVQQLDARPETATAHTIESALIGGDLSKLSVSQRLAYYNQVCQSLGLNPLTKPFAYIPLNGKLTLYALRDCTDQLRKIHNVSVTIVERGKFEESVYVVRAHAVLTTGRTDEALGAVQIAGLKGEPLANSLMRAETKAKRRVTLSICGLGWLDETEAETLQHEPRGVPLASVRAETVDTATGEIVEAEPAKPEPPKPGGWDDWFDDLTATADEGIKKLELTWKKSSVEYRRYLTTQMPDRWDDLKKHAAQVPV